MVNTLIKIKMGPNFAKKCNAMFKKYGDDIFYEWWTATGKVFQDIAYRKSFDRKYQWVKMTPNAVQKSFIENPGQIYRFVLAGNNLRAYSMGTLKHIKMVFFLSARDLMKKSKRQSGRYTTQEIYDDLIESHGEHIAIIDIVGPKHIYLESFYGSEKMLKAIVSGYDVEVVESSIKGNFDLYL